MNDCVLKCVTAYFDKHIEKWLKNGLVPTSRTIIEMQQAIFHDTNSYELEKALREYCAKRGIKFKKKKMQKTFYTFEI